MGVVEAFESLIREPNFRERVTGVFHLPARLATYQDLSHELHPLLIDALTKSGVSRFYSHQALAIETALLGKDVVVVTGTGSGKSVCYNVPIVQKCLTEPVATALYLFPTKALAQDQAKNLSSLLSATNIRVGVFDGDTPRSQRTVIRKSASIIVTNPDMLHVGILPQHETWSRFFRTLQTIVIDEAHTYTGVFGSHVANVVRRLLRICSWYCSSPNIIACTATIADPSAHYFALTGRESTVIDKDGAPKSDRYCAFIDAPSMEASEGFSANKDSATLLSGMCAERHKTLVFCRSRPATELVVRHAERMLKKSGVVGVKVDSYRGGYTAKERRQIEKDLFQGRLSGLATTNAMELGVDIGGLDAVVMNGYPGRLSSFWQQAGRAGRGERAGLSIMVAHNDPLEQFLARDPARIVHGGLERTSLNPENKHVLSSQLVCAAYERPLSAEDLNVFGVSAQAVSQSLVDEGQLVMSGGRLFLPRHASPAGNVNIRGSSSDIVTLVCNDEEVGVMEKWRAFQYAHEGAVYMHRSKTYLVRNLDIESNVATLDECDLDYYTQSLTQSVVQPTVTLGEHKLGVGEIALVGVRVTTVVKGFRKIALEGRRVMCEETLDLPPQKFDTVGVKISFAHDSEIYKLVCGTHGVEHALTAIAPYVASCDRRDLGSAWYSLDPPNMEPSVYLFDVVPGGIGLCEVLFNACDEWIELASRLLVECKCADGCPACLLSSSCECSNENLDKSATAQILQSLR